MRRSAAPSFQSAAKRLKFLSDSVDSELQIKKENELFNLWNSDSNNINNLFPKDATKHEVRKYLKEIRIFNTLYHRTK